MPSIVPYWQNGQYSAVSYHYRLFELYPTVWIFEEKQGDFRRDMNHSSLQCAVASCYLGSGIGSSRDGCGIRLCGFGCSSEGVLHITASCCAGDGYKGLRRPVEISVVYGYGSRYAFSAEFSPLSNLTI